MRAFWQTLYDFGADIVVAGHDHDYERFAPQDANGKPDPEHGIRQFVVGTGGKSLYPFTSVTANSEVRDADTYGLLRLTLHPTRYEWEFIPEAGKAFADVGSGRCHGRRAPLASHVLQFTPIADAAVDGQLPADNFGLQPHLAVDGSPAKESYLKFDLSGLDGPVSVATLRLYVTNDSEQGGSIARMTGTGWSETTVTYKDRPAIDGPILSTLERVDEGRWYEFDVTAAVTGNGIVSLGLMSKHDNGVSYASRENAAFAPQLVVRQRQ